MGRLSVAAIALLALSACGGGQTAEPATAAEPSAEAEAGEAGGEEPAREGEFVIRDSDDAGYAHGVHPSELEATATEAAMRLFVVNPDTGPIQGIVIKMTAPDGTAYYTEETDAAGYAEVLVPVGQRYQIEYLSLGRRDTTASVEVPEGPRQDIRLTLRYRRIRPPPPPARTAAPPPEERFVLDGVLFPTGSAALDPESYPRLDRVVEYMTHRPSSRIRVAGHTDNVGDPDRNQALSLSRAQAVRDYLVEHGIDGSRIEAVGYGDQQPVAPNDTEEGRRRNRRIEAIEL